jgi:hypothetical protein
LATEPLDVRSFGVLVPSVDIPVQPFGRNKQVLINPTIARVEIDRDDFANLFCCFNLDTNIFWYNSSPC